MTKPLLVAVQRTACHQHVRAGRYRASDRFRADAAVDLDVDIGTARSVEHRTHFSDLGFHGFDVFLPAEAGVHRHHQYKVDEVEHVLDFGGRSGGVERNARRGSERRDLRKRAVQVRAGLDVHDQPLTASLHVLLGHSLGSEHHQVRLERHLRVRTSGGNDVGTEREVGHELAVHHVPLDAIDAGGFQSCDLFAEAREVGGQDAWRNLDASHQLEGSGVSVVCMTVSQSMGAPANFTETVHAEKLVAGGDALAHLVDGRVVFVEGALPGETAVVEVHTSKRDFARGVATAIVESSPSRVVAPCPRLAAGCGGCSWQHAQPDAQLQWKTEIVAEAMQRIAKLPHPDVRTGGAVEPWHYRTTLRLAVANDETVGLRAASSHRVVSIDDCLVAHPVLVGLLPGLRVRGADEISLRVSVATGEVTAFVDKAGAQARGLPEFVRVGADAAVHEGVAGVRLRVSAASFFQSGPQAAELLVTHVQDACGALLVSDAGPLLDAYGGVGLFSATLAKPAGMTAIVVESSESACRDATNNLGADAQVVCSRLEDWTPQSVRLVVADPSRSGLGRDGVAVLAATEAERIVLVSCDAASLARDAVLLAAAGYQHTGSTVLDLFPHTPHVEVVTRFDRQ